MQRVVTPARDREALDQAIVRGSELLKQGKLADAQRMFRTALEIDGENVRVLALLGLAHFRAAEFDYARPIYEDLVARAPTDASHRLNLGLVYLKLNDAARAITSLEASRALDPSQGRAVSYLGLAYARAGRYAEAYRSFLLAGQVELAAEIEANLTAAERDGINAQLGRNADPAIARTPTPPSSPHAIARTGTPPRGVEPPPRPPSRTPTPPRGSARAEASERAGVEEAGVASEREARAKSVELPRTATPPRGIPVSESVPIELPRTPTPSRGIGPPAPPPARPTPPPVTDEPPARATPPPPPKSHTSETRIPTIPPEADEVSSSITEPRTKPPSAPPKGKRGKSGEIEFRVEFSQPQSVEETSAVPTEVPGFERASERQILAEIPVDKQVKTSPPVQEPLRMTESMQFVLRAREQAAAAARPADGQSMVSMAITTAEPSPAVAVRTLAGGLPPRPLSELATEALVRPDEGSDPFEIGSDGALLIRVADRVMTRLSGVHVTGGDLAYEPAMRRSRGHQIEERFEGGGMSMHAVSGRGYLIAAPGAHTFHGVALDDDILYIREDLLFAFETSLRWENGNVPGLRGKLHVVQFRGDGALVLKLARPLVRVKLPPQGMVFVDAERLAGWVGRVIPRAVVPPTGGPMGAMCVECTGEGIVLVEPAPEEPRPGAAAHAVPVPVEPAPEPAPEAEREPSAPREAVLDLDADHRDEI
jgi:uncharacterized protein (AIM24 family)